MIRLHLIRSLIRIFAIRSTSSVRKIKLLPKFTGHLLFTKRHNFRLLQIQCISRQQNNCGSKIEIWLGKSRKHCWKRRKCWLPAFSPFLQCFPKFSFPGAIQVGVVWDGVKPTEKAELTSMVTRERV